MRKLIESMKNFKNRPTKIFSLEHGAGEIIGVLKMHDGVEDYIEVNFFEDGGHLKQLPFNSKNDLRVMTNPVELTSNLKSLHSKIIQKEDQEIVGPYQRIDADMDLGFLTNTIARLVSRTDLKSLEKELLLKCMDSLILEVGHVFKVNSGKARGIVSGYMQVA